MKTRLNQVHYVQFSHTPGAHGIDVILFVHLVPSGFYFNPTSIINNHPHQPCLAKSECAERWLQNIQYIHKLGLI